MEEPQLLVKVNPPNWFKVLVVVIIGLGIFFRFAHLGQKIYCCDESWTSVAISGHTVADLQQEVSHHLDTIPITNFDKYQHINPERNVVDTVNYLITSDPQHPPLYYVIVRLWAQVFGDSPIGVRSLSAIISLLVLPSVYWLCLELFDTTVVGWVAMALVAVSPLQLYFAQEARQYSLWMVEILVANAALLRAIKQNNRSFWAFYTCSLVLGLYTHLFTVLFIIAHGIYVVIQERFRLTKIFSSYLISTVAAFLMLLPWLIVFITHIKTALDLTSGFAVKSIDNPFELIAIFLIRLTRIFFDLNLTKNLGVVNKLIDEGTLYYSTSALTFSLILIIYLLFFLLKDYQNKTTLFIILFGGFPSLLLIIYDLSSGGIRSIQFRYQLPLYLSIEIIVAYLLSFAVCILKEQNWRIKMSQLIMIIFLLAGLVSDVKFYQAGNWWTQTGSTFMLETGIAINKSERPLLITNNSPVNLGGILALSRYFSKINLLPITDSELLPIPPSYSQIFFMQNNSSLFRRLERDKNYSLKVIRVLNPPPGGLWEFEKVE